MMRLSSMMAGAMCVLIANASAAGDANVTTPERRTLSWSSPKYPTKARNERLEGDVTVCYTIDARGKVRRPFVKKSSAKVFNRSALRAAKAIVYEAAAPDAANERAPGCSTYRFRLEPEKSAETN